MKCALLSNVNVESLARRIAGHEVYIADGYGAWVQELASPDSALWRSEPASVFLVLDGTELARGYEGGPADPVFAELDGHLRWVEGALERLPAVKFFVSALDVMPQAVRSSRQGIPERSVEHHWHSCLATLGARHSNLYVLDLKGLVESIGRQQFYSSKRWYFGGIKYSIQGEKLLATEITRILDAQVHARKKCLLVDLDNTLWGGVIGEDGLTGITLSEVGEGARFKDFQRKIRRLRDLGVILGVVSKNNEADVLEVFETHPDMVLKKDDFASLKINWSPKPQNIAELAQDLDIGTDSFVFVDDNPVEREAVRTSMPQVTVPEFPADTCQLGAFLDEIYRGYFFALESTEEDRKRTETYLQNAKRAADRQVAGSVEEFLAALETKITLGKIDDEDLARAAQLTQKTNQFNLTTRRYSEQEMQALRTSRDSAVYIASVSDKYGDNGKVFLAIVRRLSADVAEFDTFLMSCRVMGRFLEDQIFDHFAARLRQEGVSKLRAHFIPTKKNLPARTFLDRLRGQVVHQDEQGSITWEYDLGRGSPVTKPAYAELRFSS